jgi:hypothetical protein
LWKYILGIGEKTGRQVVSWGSQGRFGCLFHISFVGNLVMKLFDFPRESEDPDSCHFGSAALKSMEDEADRKRSAILSAISKLSINPQDILLGYSHEPSDRLLCCLPTEPELHRQDLHRTFWKFLYDHVEKFPDGYNLSWPCTIPSELKSLPSIPAIYFCVRRDGAASDEEIWYIGKTSNLNTRWKSHHKQRALEAVGATWLHFQPMVGISDSDISLLERIYILMFEPAFNDRLVALGGDHEEVEAYQRGFEDGYERASEDAIAYFNGELSRLHTQIFHLQARVK